jgi:hypothetical protein
MYIQSRAGLVAQTNSGDRKGSWCLETLSVLGAYVVDHAWKDSSVRADAMVSTRRSATVWNDSVDLIRRSCRGRFLPCVVTLVLVSTYSLYATNSFLSVVMQTPGSTGESHAVRPSWKRALPVPLNPECSMIQNIVGIYHDPTAGALRVELRDNRRLDATEQTQACLRPYLIARLSGPAIGLVEQWSYGQNDDHSAFVEGYYHVPTTGWYFLEITVLLCNGYDDDLLRQAQTHVQGDHSGEADAAFAEERLYTRNQSCIVSPEYGRLTAENTTIMVDVASRAVDQRRVKGQSEDEDSTPQKIHGFWERSANGTQRLNETDEPLYTRYMPLECAQECDHPAVSNQRFEPYRFSWTVGEGDSRRAVREEDLAEKVRTKSEERRNDTFCLFGDSHIYYLVVNHLPKYVVNPLQLSSIYMASTLGENLTFSNASDSTTRAGRVRQRLEETGNGKLEHCSFILVQIAAWDTGWLPEAPTSVSLYERNMLKTIQNLQLAYPSAALYVWSPHPVPLGLSAWINCPAYDWRNPPIIDAYKAALQRVVAAAAASASLSNLPKYLDTSFITQPMWDYTWDWAHSGVSVSDARALFIAATLLQVF